MTPRSSAIDHKVAESEAPEHAKSISSAATKEERKVTEIVHDLTNKIFL